MSISRPVAFELEVSAPISGTTTVVPHGELDLATASQLEASLEDLCRARADVVLDLSEVTFLDSCALHVLLRARSKAGKAHTGLRLARPTRPVRRAIEAAVLSDTLYDRELRPRVGANRQPLMERRRMLHRGDGRGAGRGDRAWCYTSYGLADGAAHHSSVR